MKTDGFCYVIPKSVRQSKTPLLKTDANRFRDKTTCKVVLLCKIVILNSVRIT